METNTFEFEICANSTLSALAAQAGGAHRVELCAAIPEGGTTPSYGEITTARDLLKSTRLHIIIRPRAGDFLYSDLEIRTMLNDIAICKNSGVDGIVVGCLNSSGDIDLPLMKELIAASAGMTITFHRAFDTTRDPFRAMDDIISLGCERILTSGQEKSAEAGINLLAQLQQHAAGRIKLIAGSGINPSNIRKIHELTGITEFHFSARSTMESPMIFRNKHVSMNSTAISNDYIRSFTTAANVKECINALIDTITRS